MVCTGLGSGSGAGGGSVTGGGAIVAVGTTASAGGGVGFTGLGPQSPSAQAAGLLPIPRLGSLQLYPGGQPPVVVGGAFGVVAGGESGLGLLGVLGAGWSSVGTPTKLVATG
jgi:hypothetical protein